MTGRPGLLIITNMNENKEYNWRDSGQEEKGTTEDEMARWHH